MSRLNGSMTPSLQVDKDQFFGDRDDPFPVLVPALPTEHSSGDIEEVLTSDADDTENEVPNSDSKERPSRRRRLTQSIKKRTASLKSELSFGKKKSSGSSSELCSRRGSNTESFPTLPPSTTPSARQSLSGITLTSSPVSLISNKAPPLSPTLSKTDTPVADTNLNTVEQIPLLKNTDLFVPNSAPHSALREFGPIQRTHLVPKRKPVMTSRKSSASLDPAAAFRRQQFTEHTTRTQQIAIKEENDIRQAMAKKGHQFPNFKFLDFIGKGTYGRVFHAHDLAHNPPREVAIKIMNIDDVDYVAHLQAKDAGIEEVRKEIQILMQLKDHGARNVNLILDVLEVERYLWLICDYCPGGSLRTLLYASDKRCDERYVRVIARELAIGLQAIHDADIIHRDLKAANVMIHERGGLQIIDFGVAGMMESKVDKRSTIIGTPHWMPPEHHQADRTNSLLQYGFEADIWSYIVTIYEIATGGPPHANLPVSRVGTILRSRPPRLSEDKYPKDLCDFVEFVAQVDPKSRPSIDSILQHPYILGSEATHPTSMLRDLVEKFMDWTFSGGQRASLFQAGGAQSASDYGVDKGMSDQVDFIFSTTRDLGADFDSDDGSMFDDNQVSPSADATSFLGHSPSSSLDDFAMDPQDEYTSRPAKHSLQQSFDSANSDPNVERRVARGGQALEAIFNENQQPYGVMSQAKSDLPLRDDNDSSGLARKEVDFNQSFASRSDVELADADTIKSKRKQQPKDRRETMGGWQFDYDNIEANMMNDADTVVDSQIGPPPAYPLARPTLKHAETAPDKITQARASTATMNLDDLMGDDDWQSGSAMGRSPTGLSTPLEDEDMTIRHNITELNESSFPSYASSIVDTSASEDESVSVHGPELNGYTRGRKPVQYSNMYADIQPPSAEAMRDDAPQEIVELEVKRLLSGFMGELAALADEFPTEDDITDEEENLEDGEGELDHGDEANGIHA